MLTGFCGSSADEQSLLTAQRVTPCWYLSLVYGSLALCFSVRVTPKKLLRYNAPASHRSRHEFITLSL